ncbi:MAG: beta-lactamase family protein [Clostridia bacterium]|nr:beta-lactamase family protein [Clostridia bacterium]
MTDNRLAVRIDAFVKRLQKEDVNMHGFILSINGKDKAKACYAPFSEGQPHRMYSVSKTMTGIAVGMLIDDGKLSLDDHIADHFQDWLSEKTDGRLLRLTIRDMLRMATCYRWTTYREGVDENWAKTFFTGTPTHEPGTVFYYDTGCSQVLAALVKRLSGQEVIDFLDDRLFGPLCCRDERYWLRDPSGCCQGGTGLCMSLRDLHRVALCLLNGGEGVVPVWYAEEMGKKQIETLLQSNEEEQYGYGWQCWRTRAGWAMYGLGGQLAVVCPDKKTVLSTIADTRLDPCGVQRIYNAFFEEVYPFIGEEDMDCEILKLKTHTVPDKKEYGISETGIYVFPENNQLNIKSLYLKDNCLYYENDRGSVSLPFGRGRNEEIPYPGWPSVPALASGGWAEPDLLRIRCYAVGEAPCGFDMLVRFGEKHAAVQCRKSYDPVTVGYDGVAAGYLRADG